MLDNSIMRNPCTLQSFDVMLIQELFPDLGLFQHLLCLLLAQVVLVAPVDPGSPNKGVK